jgi:hypothetical protein
MPADDRFTIRAFQPGDEAAILDLFARCFPHATRTLDHFRWKYQRNPFGNEHISLAFDGASLVGHYSGYCVPFWCGGAEVLAHQIGDTMTDPSIRHVGRGPTSILGRTALHFYQTFCDDRVAFNYGFNVANIQRFSLRFLRSDRVEPVTYRVLTPRAPSRWSRRMRGLQFEIVNEIGTEYDDLFARVAPDYRFLVKRDAKYLRWRYRECPDVDYLIMAVRKWRRLVGWAVFRPRDGRLSLGDLLFDRHHVAALDLLLRECGAREIDAWLPPRPEWLGAGFEARREPQDLSLMCVPFTMSDATERMRRELLYTWGDSDLF